MRYPVWVQPALLAVLVVLGACRTGRDYPDPATPRYGGAAPAAQARTRGDTIHVVSFNIEFAQEMTRAIRILKTRAELRDADIVLLQEMDARGAKMAADSLRMHYVYYPAIYHRLARKDFGNAVLSRWPIVANAKLILPSRSRYAKTQRIATAATIDFGGRTVRVYSTHLGTPADLGHAGRVEQLRFIIRDAARHDRVILGGDMNSRDIGQVARDEAFVWPTDTIPASNSFGRLDHIFLRGVRPLDGHTAGTVHIGPGISDHRPIWVKALVSR